MRAVSLPSPAAAVAIAVPLLLLLATCGFTVGAAEMLRATVHSATPRSGSLPSDFASVSSEVQCAPMFINGADDSYVNLLTYLKNTSRGDRGPNIRIGGNSADWDCYTNDPHRVPPTKLDTILVNDTMIAAYNRVSDWGGTMIIDISLTNQTDPTNALDYLAAVFRIVKDHSTIQGIEIGNEPDLFSRNGIRLRNYTFSQYQEDFSLYLLALKQQGLITFPFVQGAAACCFYDKDLIGYVGTFAARPYNVLISLSRHYYPMSGASATFEKLLAPPAARGVEGLSELASATVAMGIPFHIGEGNSAYNGGKEGVSNSFAAALWAVDTMFNAAVNNMTRFNFHGCPGRSYTPITTDVDPATGKVYARARPLYYGMLAFTEATAYGAHVVDTEVTNATRDANVQVWATVAKIANGSIERLCVVILQKNLTAVDARPLNVSVGRRYGGMAAVVTRSHPISFAVNATEGILYGGQTFDTSHDGRPSGERVVDTLRVDEAGQVTVRVLPASVTLVEVHLPL